MKFSWIYSLFNAANKNWTSRIFTLILISCLTYSATQIFKAKGKAADCSAKIAEAIKPFKETLTITSELLKELKPELAKETGFIDVANTRSMMPAVFIEPDTTPINKVRISKIDSLLKRIDSLNKKTKS